MLPCILLFLDHLEEYSWLSLCMQSIPHICLTMKKARFCLDEIIFVAVLLFMKLSLCQSSIFMVFDI